MQQANQVLSTSKRVRMPRPKFFPATCVGNAEKLLGIIGFALLSQQGTQIVYACQSTWMFGTKLLFIGRYSFPVQRLCFFKLAQHGKHFSQVAHAGQRPRVLRPEFLLVVRESPTENRLGI